MADGVLTFDTKCDVTGVNNASKVVEGSLKRMGGKIKATFGMTDAEKAAQRVQSLKQSYDNATAAVERQKQKVEALRAEIKALQDESARKSSAAALAETPAAAQPLIEQAESLKAQIAEAKQNVAVYREKWKNGEGGADKAQSDWLEKVRNLKNEYAAICDKIDQIIAKEQTASAKSGGESQKIEKLNTELVQSEAKLGSLAGKADLAKKKLNSASDAKKVRKLSMAFGNASTSVKRFTRRLSSIVSSALFFTVITKALTKVREAFGNVLKSNTQFSKSWATIKGNLLTAFQPIYEACLPALMRLMQFLEKATAALASFFAALTGKSVAQMQKNASALYKQSNATKKAGDEAKKAARSLASFDEINQLSDNTSSKSDESDSIEPSFDYDYSNPYLDSFSEKIGKIVEQLKEFAAKLKISFKDVFVEWNNLTGEKIAKKIITGLSGLAGAVIGFSIGGVPGAIVGTLAGLAIGLIASSVFFNNDGKIGKAEVLRLLVPALNALVGGIIGFAIGGPGGALLGASIGFGLTLTLESLGFDFGELADNLLRGLFEGLGLENLYDDYVRPSLVTLWNKILDFFGIHSPSTQTKWVGQMLIQGALDGFSENWSKIEDWWDENIAPIFTQEFWQEKWDNIKQSVSDSVSNIKTKITDTLTQTKDSAKEKIDSIKNGIVDGFNSAKDKVVGIFNTLKTKVSDIWNGIWNVIKNVINSVLSGVERFVNGIIKGLNFAINALNRLQISIPDWVPEYGGKKLGFNIKNISEVTLPRLATGTYIPANYGEFAAILGDNKREAEVVSPISAMKQAFLEALTEGGSQNGGSMVINLVIDRDVIGKAFVEYHNGVVARTRVSPLKGVR